jgi:hypothetical protein
VTDELLPSDLVAEAKAMWGTTFWQRMTKYLRARRDTLMSVVNPPADTRAMWIREGAVAELNRMLRGDAFLAEVIAQAQQRAAAAEPEEEATPTPAWMGLRRGDVLDG